MGSRAIKCGPRAACGLQDKGRTCLPYARGRIPWTGDRAIGPLPTQRR
jgi:hypothetical protein